MRVLVLRLRALHFSEQEDVHVRNEIMRERHRLGEALRFSQLQRLHRSLTWYTSAQQQHVCVCEHGHNASPSSSSSSRRWIRVSITTNTQKIYPKHNSDPARQTASLPRYISNMVYTIHILVQGGVRKNWDFHEHTHTHTHLPFTSCKHPDQIALDCGNPEFGHV